MNGWATFWAVTLVAALILFSLVAIMVTIGGVRDLRSLFADTRRRDDGDGRGEGVDTGADRPDSAPARESES